MRGKEVFYPVGWDDNGLATERRTQNYYGVRCDPSLPYLPGYQPPRQGPGPQAGQPRAAEPVSRRNFTQLCRELSARDERAYQESWRQLGLSVDWSMAYRTIDDRCAATAQRGFLRSLARGEAYQAAGPVLWDVTYQTAVAQAEVEERPVRGAYHRIAFSIEAGPGSEPVLVATTRPELLPACVALVVHPGDPRHAALAGRSARSPLFGVSVPVRAHPLADPDEGTGVAMVCTFGDQADLQWWRDLALDTRPVLDAGGRFLPGPPAAITSAAGRAAYARLAGLTAVAARSQITGLLRADGSLRGEPEPVTRRVKFYEKGDQPLEILTSRQWYIRNGGRDEALRELMLARGRELTWHPAHMRSRYEDWVRGLTGDWLVSRQRYSGVPIPVWYPLGEDGAADYQRPLLPADSALPVDPAADAPPGYTAGQRGQPGGFAADPDVMDTWATSSLTPQIAGGWPADQDLMDRVFPMDLRPQAHDIIRTWLFYTVLRSQAEHGALPWRHVAISGWILDRDRKKMSKSAGNVTTPAQVLAESGADAVRYWAASARLGVDAAFDPGQVRVGRRLAVKIFNASRFVLTAIGPASPGARVTEPLDQAMLARLAEVIGQCTAAFEAFDHAQALACAERFFWSFCDDYLELVKPRGYGELGPGGAASAARALRLALSAQLRLFAPVLPFATEEVWSGWQDGSIHRAAWPDPAQLTALAGGTSPGVLDAAAAAIAAVRKAKSQARLPMRAPVRKLAVSGPEPGISGTPCPGAPDHAAPGLAAPGLAAPGLAAPGLDAIRLVLADLRAAGHIGQVELHPAGPGELVYAVTL
jgi:valyl-tRNA synthetase